ncbi:HNH endonuclease signature motif containing protein [Blastococcus jejuensis]
MECGAVAPAPTAPTVGWASGPLGAAQAADREIARQTALRARALAAFAATRPASADRQPGHPGAMSSERRASRPEVLADVSEWAAQELAIALSITTPAAEMQVSRALTLVHRLPGVLSALEAGSLHVGHLWPLLEKVAPIGAAAVRARLERDLLAWIAGRSVTTPAQLGSKIRRELLARNVRTAAQELKEALARRGVRCVPASVDGMAMLQALLTVPEAEALLDALGRYADALDDTDTEGPPRTRQQKMADCMLDLVLRPGETQLPTVQAQLTVVAPVAALVGGDQPGEVNDHPVPAEMVRALAKGLGLLPDDGSGDDSPSTPATAVPPAEFTVDPDDEVTGLVLAAADERWWAEVEARALRGEWGGEDDPPLDQLERYWAAEAEWMADWPDADDESFPRELGPDAAPGTGPDAAPDGAAQPMDGRAATATEPDTPWWALADRSVAEAGRSLLELDRRLAAARRAVERARLADLDDRDDWEQSPAGRVSAATDAISALAHASVGKRAALAELLDRTAGGGLADRPRIAVTDALTGALLVLTDARELRAAAVAGRGLGPPDASSTYRPGLKLDRFVRARDRRCRFPGCRRRVPLGGELDHRESWPDGATSAENLVGFCTGHHRGKHQAPGWCYELTAEGTLIITTPSGLTATTDPPPF